MHSKEDEYYEPGLVTFRIDRDGRLCAHREGALLDLKRVHPIDLEELHRYWYGLLTNGSWTTSFVAD